MFTVRISRVEIAGVVVACGDGSLQGLHLARAGSTVLFGYADTANGGVCRDGRQGRRLTDIAGAVTHRARAHGRKGKCADAQAGKARQV